MASRPKEYWPWASVFSEEAINKLPEHSKCIHEINLVPGAVESFRSIYTLSENNVEALQKYLKPNLESRKVRRSSSSAGTPIIFISKKDGSLRLYVNYGGINKFTIKDHTALRLMTELREQLSKANIFTLLDFKNGYNLVHIKEVDEWKTVIGTRYGLFGSTDMPFVMCNAPDAFHLLIYDVLRDPLDADIVVYIDDILIYLEKEKKQK